MDPATEAFAKGLARVARGWWKIFIVMLLGGALAYACSYLVQPTFTSTTTFMPPQQSQTASTLGAIAALGPLAGLAGGANLRTPADQYVSLMQSATVLDRLINQFELKKIYDVERQSDARKQLLDNTRMSVGKRDGLITVQVSDIDPERAGKLANEFVNQLRQLADSLALTEAKQRRVFFEQRMNIAKEQLGAAQLVLQSSGFGPSALKTEPQSQAESYGRLRAEIVAAEVKLQALRRLYTDTAPEVTQLLASLSALRAEAGRKEQSMLPSSGADYVSHYREFKYQEALFEIFARQYELARADESREGALIQIIDTAGPADKKSAPVRALHAAVGALFGFFLALIWFVRRPES
jgi:uncharacterized protein involved in exopolysaccharide biosynthesis